MFLENHCKSALKLHLKGLKLKKSPWGGPPPTPQPHQPLKPPPNFSSVPPFGGKEGGEKEVMSNNFTLSSYGLPIFVNL